MKIQIIKLDSHDDILTAIDKLAWSKAARTLLVWPKGSHILTRHIDLVLLHRHCQENGSQLAICTDNAEVRINAREIGIPQFLSESQAMKGRWRKPKVDGLTLRPPIPDLRSLKPIPKKSTPGEITSRLTRWHEKRWVRLAFFCSAIAAMLILVSAFYPSATIILSPSRQDQEVQLNVVAGSQIKAVNISGTIPARTISVIVEGNDSLPTTGTTQIADHYAVGQVTFTNLGENSVEIPAGTIVESLANPIIRYMTTQTVSVKAGPGNTANAPIKAVLPGSQANLLAGNITGIEGSLGLELSVNNFSSASGGSETTSSSASERDFVNLREEIISSLQKNAYDQITSKLNSGDRLIQNSIKIQNVLDEESEPAQGQPADVLTMSLRLEFTGLYLSGDDLQELGTANLDANLPENYQPVEGSLSIIEQGMPTFGQDATVNWKFIAKRRLQVNLDSDHITDRAAGQIPLIASINIKNSFPVAALPTVQMNPAWWPRLPIFSFRISVIEASYANPGS